MIVEQSVPAGDQFLFISAPAGKRIEVTFVDPDAVPDELPEEDRRRTRRALARAGRGDERSVQYVLAELERSKEPCARSEVAEGGASRRWPSPRSGTHPTGTESSPWPSTWIGSTPRRRRRSGWVSGWTAVGARTERRSAELVELLAERLYVLENALAGLEAATPARSS